MDIVGLLVDHFNPRSPCGERLPSSPATLRLHIFQSTLPVWGATGSRAPFTQAEIFQSTLPVWGATLYRVCPLDRLRFQSTLPVWGATCGRLSAIKEVIISIHAPRVGSDSDTFLFYTIFSNNFNPRSPCGERRTISVSLPSLANFNPRSPCGERPAIRCTPQTRAAFQSTLPVWGATKTGRG